MGLTRTGQTVPPNDVSASAIVTGTRTTTSSTYVDWPASEVLSFSFTKRRSDTRLIVEFSGTAYINSLTSAPNTQWAVRINGTDYEVARYVWDQALAHKVISGITAPITSIPAGTYTITLRAKTSAQTLTVDTAGVGFGDVNSVRVTEVPA